MFENLDKILANTSVPPVDALCFINIKRPIAITKAPKITDKTKLFVSPIPLYKQSK